jgi:hypothetical protein
MFSQDYTPAWKKLNLGNMSRFMIEPFMGKLGRTFKIINIWLWVIGCYPQLSG